MDLTTACCNVKYLSMHRHHKTITTAFFSLGGHVATCRKSPFPPYHTDLNI